MPFVCLSAGAAIAPNLSRFARDETRRYVDYIGLANGAISDTILHKHGQGTADVISRTTKKRVIYFGSGEIHIDKLWRNGLKINIVY